MLSYDWQGIEAAAQRIARLASLSGLESELEAEGDAVVKEAQIYPPERAGQRYRRSEKLKGGWKRSAARRSGGAVEVDVFNPTEYGPFVQGEDQAPVHQGRWKKLKTIGEERRGELRTKVQGWALRVWRGG